jgi:hypothetical protein
MSVDRNYGIATPVVRLLTSLPKVTKKRQVYNFDVSATSWKALQNSPYLSPLLAESVSSSEETWGCIFPSKRKAFMHNFIDLVIPATDTDPATTTAANVAPGSILWTPVPPTGILNPGVITDYIEDLPSYYSDIEPDNSASRVPTNTHPDVEVENYTGPLWSRKSYKEQPRPDDKKIIKNFLNIVRENLPTSTTSVEEPNLIEGGVKLGVYQSRVADGLWWGIESNAFLDRNMPFWVTLETASRPPAPAENETFFIISLGVDSGSNNDRYDLVLSYNKKPQLIDYYGVDPNGNGEDKIVKEFDLDTSRLLTTDERIDVGFMTAGGRLIVFVNGTPLVYTRIIKTGAEDSISTLKEANITAGSIRVYGGNVACKVYAYPMTFAEISIVAFPIPNKKTIDTDNGTEIVDIEYSASNEENAPTGLPVCVLPVNADAEGAISRYGVDTKQFIDQNGLINLQPSFGLHREGKMIFFSAEELANDFTALPNTNFFFLVMKPEDRIWEGGRLKHAKTPYFMRLKGVDQKEGRDPVLIGVTDVTDDLITLKEDASAPDYFHIKRGASFTLYNENGRYDFIRQRQLGVDISWGWNGKTCRTFTGMTVSTSNNQVAGKETLTVQCEDYNYILQNTPIVNSPYYDGMVGFHAVKDLAKRAGLEEFDKDWEDDHEYFLKSGYSFTSPAVRFKATDKIFDCIMNIVKRFEAYIYFDAFGTMHIDKLPGGLLGVPPVRIPIEFTSDPTDTDKILILDNKTINIDLNSTVNHISILTLDRDTRNPIIYALAAEPPDYDPNTLLFKKKMMIDQPAYGELNVATAHAKELALRVFKPIRKTSFKTVGLAVINPECDPIIEPLEFITVDGVEFRLISISRNYNAESNDFTQDYEAEWLNG